MIEIYSIYSDSTILYSKRFFHPGLTFIAHDLAPPASPGSYLAPPASPGSFRKVGPSELRITPVGLGKNRRRRRFLRCFLRCLGMEMALATPSKAMTYRFAQFL